MGATTIPALTQGGQENLTLQQTITSSGSVTIPTNVTQVYAIVIGGGGSGGTRGGGGAGGFAQGWVRSTNTCTIGAGGSAGAGGISIYGNLIVGGGAQGSSTSAPILGGAGAGGYKTSSATLSTLNTYTITVGSGGAGSIQRTDGNGTKGAAGSDS